MKVKELINILQNEDMESHVMLYLYNTEDGGMLNGVKEQDRNNPEELFYHKGDHPLSYLSQEKVGDKVVCLTGS